VLDASASPSLPAVLDAIPTAVTNLAGHRVETRNVGRQSVLTPRELFAQFRKTVRDDQMCTRRA
jgi:hypothetical protein